MFDGIENRLNLLTLLYLGLCILLKVWTSTSDLPALNIYVQTFFLEKLWLRNTLPTYDLDIRPFRSFFSDLSPKPFIRNS